VEDIIAFVSESTCLVNLVFISEIECQVKDVPEPVFGRQVPEHPVQHQTAGGEEGSRLHLGKCLQGD